MKTLLAAFVLVVSMHGATADHPFLTNVSELFVTGRSQEIVRHPEKIDACLLRSVRMGRDKGDFNVRYEELRIVDVTPLQVSLAQAELLRESSYGWGYSSACLPKYYARLRFHKGVDIVAIDFCFDCQILRVLFNGVELNQKEFVTPAFLSNIKEIFPDDLGLTGMKQK